MLDSGEFGGPQGAFSGGPLGGLLDDRDLISQAVDKFGNPLSRVIGFGFNTALANMNPIMGIVNTIGTGKNLLDAVIDKSPLTGNPDLDLTNPNKFADDPGVFSGQTQSPGYGYGNIAGFDIEGGPYQSLGTMLGDAVVGAIEEGFPNVEFGIDSDAVPLGVQSVSSGMGMGGGPDAAQMSPDAFGMADPLGLDNALSTNLYSFPKQYLDYYEIEDFSPNLEFDTTIPNPAFDPDNIKNNPQDVWDAIDSIPGFNLSSLDDAVFDLDTAIASTSPNAFESAFGIGYSGVSPDMGAVSQEGGEALQQALAQRAVENILSEQAPRQMINVTPPAPPKVAPQRRAAPKPSPIQVAAKAITRPEAVKELPKFAQESLRQGKVPTGLNSRNQDLVDRVLATPKVDIMSAGVNVKGNRALQKARSRAAQDAK
jgi:hypothetical protein